MRTLVPLSLSVLAAALLSGSAAAQACVGLPSFARPLHVNLSVELPEGASVYAAGLGLGMSDGLFGGAGGGQVSFDDLEEKATFGFAEAGFQIPFGRVQACPVAGAFVQKGPDDPTTGLVVESWGATAGAAAGLPLRVGNMDLIPNAAVRFSYVSEDVEELEFFSATNTYKSTVLDLGLAFLFRDRVSVQPLVHVPLTSDDEATEEKTSFGVFASVSFGPAR